MVTIRQTSTTLLTPLLTAFNFITALHATRFSYEQAVWPSVKRVHCDKMEEKSLQIFIPYEISFSLVFLRKRRVGGSRPFLPEILGQPDPVEAKSPIFSNYSLVAHQR